MKKVIIISLLMFFIVSCQEVRIIKKSDIHQDYKETIFTNASMKKAIEDVASNFGKRDASVIIGNDVIIIRAERCRRHAIKTFFSSFK